VLASTVTLTADRVLTDHKLPQLQNLLTQRFIGDVDEKAISDGAAKGMVAALGDRWSHYKTAEEYQRYLDQMSNSYVGVGVSIQIREDGQGLDITEVTEGGGAQSAGIQPGDRLIAVDGKSILGMTTSEVAQLIQGDEGTAVPMTVVRQEKELTLEVLRKRIETVVATGLMLEDGIGLITISNFDDRCAQETITAIETLRSQGAKALIFDVRNNPGGYKRELVKLLDYLLPEGPLFRTVDYQGREEVDTSDEDFLDMPMAVLMNLRSYSAAEFFAAALEEYDAAVTVGEKTFGKGYFQNTYRLEDGSAVTLSVGKYYTPKGVSLAGVGLTPKVEVPLDEETAAKVAAHTLPPQEDPHIQAAVNVLKTLSLVS
jgi:carboxyl-terminal processing protease